MGNLHGITPCRFGECLKASMRVLTCQECGAAAERELTPFRVAP